MATVTWAGDDTAGFRLKIHDADADAVTGLLNEAGTSRHGDTYEFDAPETVEESLMHELESYTEDEGQPLRFMQSIDDTVFDDGSPLHEDDKTTAHAIPRLIKELYNKSQLKKTAKEAWSIVLLASVYMCVRAYMECVLEVK